MPFRAGGDVRGAPVENDENGLVAPDLLDDGLLLHDGRTEGWARVHGERWRVSSAEPHAVGCSVGVTGRRGLMLTVVPVADQQQGEPS